MSFLDECDALDPSQSQEPMGPFFKYVLTDTAAMSPSSSPQDRRGSGRQSL
jgi:hypothetical protein